MKINNYSFDKIIEHLNQNQSTWFLTGCAGFIGSNLLEFLLENNQVVIGLDNFSTGHQHNLDDVQNNVTNTQWKNFSFIHGDIRDVDCYEEALIKTDYVLHQAALGSVPRSINDPITSNSVNIEGFLKVLYCAQKHNVKNMVYAASSSTYGDHPALPKIEENIGKPLSPYAVTKYVNELYADVFAKTYSFNSIGLRYFNVFGRRQDPNGAYAAVIPKWVDSILNNNEIFINGDGETSRDFCYIKNVIQANIRAALSAPCEAKVYNVAVGDRTTLNDLVEILVNESKKNNINYTLEPKYRDFRAGDVRHSQASIDKISTEIGYKPTHTAKQGLNEAFSWYASQGN